VVELGIKSHICQTLEQDWSRREKEGARRDTVGYPPPSPSRVEESQEVLFPLKQPICSSPLYTPALNSLVPSPESMRSSEG
jgi:hypothetical protein